MDDLKQTKRTTPDIYQKLMDELRDQYPPLFANDGEIDPTELKNLLGHFQDELTEKYDFRWVGKQQAKKNAYTVSKAALAPDKVRSENFENTENVIIEGENLESMKLLLSGYEGKVKCIYIDPPYNTGKDFIYTDNFTEGKRAYWEQDGTTKDGVKLDTNSETAGRYHSNWLSMMYPRMVMAWKLLRDDGVIFVSIDDNEVANLRKLMDEVFGEENFVAQVEWQKRYTRSNNTDDFTTVLEHICIYQKNDEFKVNLLQRDENANARFTNPDNDPKGPWKATPFLNQVPPQKRPNLCYPITNPYTGVITNPTTKAWRYEKNAYLKLLEENGLWWGKNNDRNVPDIKTYLSEVREGMTPVNFWPHDFAGHTDLANQEIKELFDIKIFDTPKPSLLIKRVLEHGTSNDSIALDFFAGSGTTAHAVMQLNADDGGNRKYILVQIPEATDEQSEAYKAGYKKISDITIERVKRAAKKIQSEHPDATCDFGFKVFTLTQSSYPQNHFEEDPNQSDAEKAAAYKKYVSKLDEQLFFEFDEERMTYEIICKEGFSLNAKIEREHNFKENNVRLITDGESRALLCLDQTLHDDTVELVLKDEAYRKMRFIVLGRAVNSTHKWHLDQVLHENLRIV